MIQHGPDELHHDAWPGFAKAFYIAAVLLGIYLIAIIIMYPGAAGGAH